MQTIRMILIMRFRMLLEIGITSISIYRYGMLCVIFKEWNSNTGKAKVRSGKMKMERPQMDGIQRLPSVSVKRSIGTFGSVIYNKPEVENLY